MVGRTQRILRKYSSPPRVLTPAASSQWAKNIDRHFISNCHVIHLGGDHFLLDSGPISIVIFALQK